MASFWDSLPEDVTENKHDRMIRPAGALDWRPLQPSRVEAHTLSHALTRTQAAQRALVSHTHSRDGVSKLLLVTAGDS